MSAAPVEGRIVLFLRFPLDGARQHGGVHRSYQIWWECTRALGADRVTVITYRKSPRRSRASARRLRTTLQLGFRNPLALAFETQTARDLAKAETDSPALGDYRRYLQEHGRPALCIVEDVVWFRGVLATNLRLHVPTWACPQNLESLDVDGDLPFSSHFRMLARLVDVSNELEALAACEERFAISRVEVGVMSGVGLDTRWYPYRPVGAIRDYFLSIRAARMKGTIERSLFLVLGSAGRASRTRAMAWVLEQAAAGGLPRGARLEIVGQKTDELPGIGSLPHSCRVQGWVDERQLTQLLTRACAVLIPQFSGFGAMTRLTETALAGIPALTTPQAEYAAGPVSGVRVLPQEWDRWADAIAALMRGTSQIPPLEPDSDAACSVLEEGLSRASNSHRWQTFSPDRATAGTADVARS